MPRPPKPKAFTAALPKLLLAPSTPKEFEASSGGAARTQYSNVNLVRHGAAAFRGEWWWVEPRAAIIAPDDDEENDDDDDDGDSDC